VWGLSDKEPERKENNARIETYRLREGAMARPNVSYSSVCVWMVGGVTFSGHLYPRHYITIPRHYYPTSLTKSVS